MRIQRREQRCRPEHVDSHGRDRVLRGERRDRLRGKMHDGIGTSGGECVPHARDIQDVAAVHANAIGHRDKVRERRILVRDAVNDAARGHEALGEMAARESRDACYENGAGHVGRVLVRGAARRGV